MNLYKQIENDIKSKNFSPIYLLMGEEELFIDKLMDLIVENSISETEREFNYTILYGKETNVDEIVSICKKFPLMSNYQVVVIKEAQDLSRTIDQLTSYTNNFVKSTILVVCYKHRERANEVHKMMLIGEVKGKDVILVDDMVDTAGTLVKAAEIMIDHGANSVRAICTHGVFSGNAYEKIENSHLTEIVVTDTIPRKHESKKVKVISVDQLFSETIRAVIDKRSISSNFIC